MCNISLFLVLCLKGWGISSSSWPHLKPFSLWAKGQNYQHHHLLSLCCLFFVLPDKSPTVRNLATPPPWVFDSLRLSIPSCLYGPPFRIPHFVSSMDTAGDITSAQDGLIDPQSIPSRSDLSGLYHLGRTLGRGHFAVVKLARHVNTGQLVAVKMIDKTKLDIMATSHLLQEVKYEIIIILKTNNRFLTIFVRFLT